MAVHPQGRNAVLTPAALRHPLMRALEIGLKLGVAGIVQLAREHFLFFGEGHGVSL